MVCPRWCVGWGLWQHLSLRVSAPGPDPQLQQSIRLLQLSTLELGQESSRCSTKPFSNAPPTKRRAREEFGLAANAPRRPTTMRR